MSWARNANFQQPVKPNQDHLFYYQQELSWHEMVEARVRNSNLTHIKVKISSHNFASTDVKLGVNLQSSGIASLQVHGKYASNSSHSAEVSISFHTGPTSPSPSKEQAGPSKQKGQQPKQQTKQQQQQPKQQPKQQHKHRTDQKAVQSPKGRGKGGGKKKRNSQGNSTAAL
jgi:hypothetical protein